MDILYIKLTSIPSQTSGWRFRTSRTGVASVGDENVPIGSIPSTRNHAWHILHKNDPYVKPNFRVKVPDLQHGHRRRRWLKRAIGSILSSRNHPQQTYDTLKWSSWQAEPHGADGHEPAHQTQTRLSVPSRSRSNSGSRSRSRSRFRDIVSLGLGPGLGLEAWVFFGHLYQQPY